MEPDFSRNADKGAAFTLHYETLVHKCMAAIRFASVAGFVCTIVVFATAVFLLAGTRTATAQMTGTEEVVTAGGAIDGKLALTPAQKNAIYNAVHNRRVQTSSAGVPTIVGAPVPLSTALGDLPAQAAEDTSSPLLKYAMVDDEVIVVDPVRMRVVGVIRSGAQP